MRNIRISSLIDAPRHIPWAEQVISLLDPDLPYRFRSKLPTSRLLPYVPHVEGKRHLVRRFLDSVVINGRYSPTRKDMEDIFSWFRPNIPTLAHCHAGMSRSVSTAMGLMLLQGSSYDDVGTAIREYEEDRCMWTEPNMLMVSYIDDILGHGGSFVDWSETTFYGGPGL